MSVKQLRNIRFALIFCLPLNFIRAEIASNSEIDILHYGIYVELSDTSNSIVGRTTIEFEKSIKSKRLSLDFAALNISKILLNNRETSFNFSDEQITIPLVDSENSDRARVEIHYSGAPTDGLLIQNNRHGRRSFFVDNWPNRAHFWFPCVDHPADKATMTLTVKAPSHYQIVANSSLENQTAESGGAQTWTFAKFSPISVYNIVFGVAEFVITEKYSAGFDKLKYWYFREDSLNVERSFKDAPQMLAYFQHRFGPFPFEKLALVQAVTVFGGMENAGAIFFNENSFKPNRTIEVTVAHEIAHQWFGDLITPVKWNNLWLSEGFASYFGAQYFEKSDSSKFRKLMRQSRSRYLKNKKWRQRAVIEPEPKNLFDLLNANTYTKGQWIVHMLRNELGDSLFWVSMQESVQSFAGSNWETADLRSICEKQAGRKLNWFFDQWLFQPGIPKLDIQYYQEKNGAFYVQIQQKQKTPTMRFPLEISFANGNSTVDKNVICSKQTEQFQWTFPAQNLELQIDKNIKLLADIHLKEKKFLYQKKSNRGSHK
ncbi:MAG: M1 family peptidase [Calditrichaeota bacterium]|nr:MAG: M1 family peptidase [Calditrichota bacterium]